MLYIKTYENLNLKNDEKEIFNYLMSTLTDSIFTWDYFTDFQKIRNNVKKIEKELNLLNVLIGKKKIEKEFISLVSEYPSVRKALPILIAIRDEKVKNLKIIDNYDEIISEDKSKLFNEETKLPNELKKELIIFFRESGLKEVLLNKEIKNMVDYCYGLEVGMDTNARKNRTGMSMEKIVEKIIENFSKDNQLEYISQATKTKIKYRWNFDILLDKTDRNFDFAVYNKSKNKLYIVETNFYSGGGSKLKSTAGEYQTLFELLKKQQIDLIWITDGLGWKTARSPLHETFLKIDYLFNLEMVKKGVLKDIIL